MMPFLKRVAEPVVRLTTVHEHNHAPVFHAFAEHLGRAVIEKSVKDRPRVVSFPLRVAK